MTKKNILIAIAALLACALLTAAALIGGRERRELAELNADSTDGIEATLKRYQDKLKERPDSAVLKYNLARLRFLAEEHEEAAKLFQELIDSETPDQSLIRKTFYNLGNVFFRLAEKEKDLNQAVSLLDESLEYYRTAIEMEKRDSSEKAENGDARFNYAVARGKLNLLYDELEKRKQDLERRKDLRQLLEELFAEEKKIKEKLATLKNRPLSGELLKERGQLLSSRKSNLNKLKIIQEKINRRSNPRLSPPKSSFNNSI